MTITTRELSPELWADLEKLFGANGACGGCWCMSWRLRKGEKWDEIKGPVARGRMRRLVKSGKALGMLAYDGGEPVGWCAYGPRLGFPRLERARSLACADAERVWSLPCFFIRRGWRDQGVAALLLRASIEALRRRGVQIAEGYPVRPRKTGERIPAAFAWTGTRSLFDAAGFAVVGNVGGGKERVRLTLRTPSEIHGT